MTLEEARKLQPGTRIRVSEKAPHHGGKVGEFDGLKGPALNCMALVSERFHGGKTIFVIDPEYATVEVR